MISKKITILVFALCGVCATAEDTAQVREFPDIRCKMTLPSSCTWVDVAKEPYSKVQNIRAGFRNKDGVLMVFTAIKLSKEDAAVERVEVAGYEEGAIIAGVSKTGGEWITYRGRPCYELKMRVTSQKTELVYRVFMANGYACQMQALNTERLRLGPQKAEELFSAFELVGTPPPVTNKPNPTDSREHDFSKKMGGLGFLGLIVALIAGIAVKVVGKKEKSS